MGGGEDVVPCFKDLINLFSKYFLSLWCVLGLRMDTGDIVVSCHRF